MKRIFLFVFLIFFVSNLLALDCPKGLVNEAYPGSCSLYTDTNGDGLCDLSQEINSVTDISFSSNYHFILITILSIFAYSISYFYFRKKENLLLHKKIWNVLLLISFIFTALTSLIYLLVFDVGLNFAYSIKSVSFWHVEIGLIMILISLFHTFWHLAYFKSFFIR